MKILKFFVYLLVFVFSLFAGFSLGTEHNLPLPEIAIAAEQSSEQHSQDQTETQSEPQVPDVPDSPPTMDIARSNNLLVIGVNDILKKEDLLEAVWLVVFHRDDPKVDIIPIFPSITEGGLMRDYDLMRRFFIDDEGMPNDEFLDTLHDRDILWHNYLLFDEKALNEITDLFELPKARDEGYLHNWENDPKESFNGQLALFDKLCKTFPYHSKIDDISSFIMTWSPHLSTDVPVHQIINDWRLLNAYGESLRCEFPTLSTQGQ